MCIRDTVIPVLFVEGAGLKIEGRQEAAFAPACDGDRLCGLQQRGPQAAAAPGLRQEEVLNVQPFPIGCLLYTSDAADERSSVDLGGRRIIKKKTQRRPGRRRTE